MAKISVRSPGTTPTGVGREPVTGSPYGRARATAMDGLVVA
jgi:hypothetical protein